MEGFAEPVTFIQTLKVVLLFQHVTFNDPIHKAGQN